MHIILLATAKCFLGVSSTGVSLNGSTEPLWVAFCFGVPNAPEVAWLLVRSGVVWNGGRARLGAWYGTEACWEL